MGSYSERLRSFLSDMDDTPSHRVGIQTHINAITNLNISLRSEHEAALPTE